MAKIYKFEAYVVDVNEDFNDAEDYIDYINNRLKYGGDIVPFNIQEVKIEWDDDIDINKMNCPIENYDKYFKGE